MGIFEIIGQESEEKITSFAQIPRFTSVGNYAVDYELKYLVKWIEREVEEEGLQLNPDFQRGHVWTEQQQVEYIEFLLRGGRTGRDFYFNMPSWHVSVPAGAYNDYVCVDGLQRITAIQKFVHAEIKAFGSYYPEFTDHLRMSQDFVRIHINDLQTKEEVLTWYLEMNAGGTPHSQVELVRVANMLKEERSHKK